MAQVEREVKEDTTRPALERVVLWVRWDRIINMKASELRTFRATELGQTVGLNRKEAQGAGNSVMSGQEASEIIEGMISKASEYRGQDKKLPDWSAKEWMVAGRQVSFISRFRGNIGDLVDEEGNPTPKAGAMMLWGRDEINASGSFPDKDEIKEEIKARYKKEKEEEKLKEKKKKDKEREERESERRKLQDMKKKKPLHESYHEMANYLLEM
jgi:hypothetical protein